MAEPNAEPALKSFDALRQDPAFRELVDSAVCNLKVLMHAARTASVEVFGAPTEDDQRPQIAFSQALASMLEHSGEKLGATVPDLLDAANLRWRELSGIEETGPKLADHTDSRESDAA
ncbi:MAG: hypothetical protein O2904_01355 [bacterium]|nr:hypothetical protein [bacterium]